MKIILPYLLLCIYATTMIKPVMPTVSDIFAHIFNYSDHMLTVHRHNGKSHVHFEYIEAAKKDSHTNAPINNLSKKTNDLSEHLMFTSSPTLLPSIPQMHCWPFFQKMSAIYLQGHLRPPIVLHT
jgi:hypothetical protein